MNEHVSRDASRWLLVRERDPRARLLLVCFPYAGGRGLAFRGWPAALPEGVEVVPVEPPGRGSRFAEPPFTDLGALVAAVAPVLLPALDRPFAFFGHSMGAITAFELARRLRAEHGLSPAHLFVSGCPSPERMHERRIRHTLPHAQFVEELRQLNGTPRQVLEHPELLELLVPLVRADLQLVETYRYAGGAPLDCPISAFGGLDDPEASEGQLRDWSAHTTSTFTLELLPGDHFFVHSAEPALLASLRAALSRLLARLG